MPEALTRTGGATVAAIAPSVFLERGILPRREASTKCAFSSGAFKRPGRSLSRGDPALKCRAIIGSSRWDFGRAFSRRLKFNPSRRSRPAGRPVYIERHPYLWDARFSRWDPALKCRAIIGSSRWDFGRGFSRRLKSNPSRRSRPVGRHHRYTNERHPYLEEVAEPSVRAFRAQKPGRNSDVESKTMGAIRSGPSCRALLTWELTGWKSMAPGGMVAARTSSGDAGSLASQVAA
jgi:hypothetical protein